MFETAFAIAHHLLVFGLFAMVAAELVLLKPGLGAPELKRLGGIDAGYGLTALLVVIVGVLRVNYGVKGGEYYVTNHWFWGKMAAFALAGLLSVPPTLAFLKWRRAVKRDPDALPAPAEISRVRGYLLAEFTLLLLVPVFAAVMARHTTVS